MRKVSVALLIALIANSSALAWGPGGHMIVAMIAYQRLNANAKKTVDQLIGLKIDPAPVTQTSLDFVNASHWPDDLRDEKYKVSFNSSFPLHFVDFPFSPDATTLPANLPEPRNILTALTNYADVLKSGKDDYARAQALRFVIHFVGDIQQPLHCAALVTKAFPGGDQGGNLFVIQMSSGRGVSDVKLHSYWDGGIGDFPKSGPNFAPPPLEEVSQAATRLLALFPDTNPAWSAPGAANFEAWAKAGSQLAETVAYKGIAPNQQPSPAYNAAALKIVRQQVVWGGYRLAVLLNSLWPETAASPGKGKK